MTDSSPASLDLTVHHIGLEKRPVIVIENFLPNPAALKEEAANAQFQTRVRFFPGVQAPFPFGRMEAFIDPYRSLIKNTFKIEHSLSVIECGFALVTMPPSGLLPLQRIPHIDTTDPHRLAILTYISGTQFGGTAFYRHKRTGYEYLDESRNSHYNEMLDRDVEKHGVPAANYITGDTEIFECIAKFDSKPGRAIIYASNSLHSGWIQNANNLVDDVTSGRLTLNAFMQVK